MMCATQEHHDTSTINHPMNTSERSTMDENEMEDSSSTHILPQVSSSPLHAQASTKSSSDDVASEDMMGGLFSQEYMNMEKPSIVLQPFQFGVTDGDNGGGGMNSLGALKRGPSVSYCNLFESYAVEPFTSQMACISEGEDDSQSHKSYTTNGSVVHTGGDAARSSSEETMTSPSSFVASNPSFIASAPSFVASVHDPWATLSDRTSIITAAATAAKGRTSMAKAISSNTLNTSASTSPDKKRSRVQLHDSNDSPTDEEREEGQQHPATRQRKRHAEKGVFTFKENGEYELMMHVQRGLPPNFGRLSALDSSNLILSVVDVYCHEEQWMFHIGQDKGKVLKAFLKECIEHKKEEYQQLNKNRMEEGEESQDQPPLVLVEIGTYCGYSAILLAKSIRELDPDLKFHIYTVETNSQNIMVASSMVLMSKFHEKITILHHQPANESLASLLKRQMKRPSTSGSAPPDDVVPADFVFFDHDKERYLDHLIEFEVNGIVQKGSYVAADNVLFHRLDGYRHHMNKLQRRGVTQTRMAHVSLEYCDEEDDCQDGIELTSYLKDPIRRRP